MYTINEKIATIISIAEHLGNETIAKEATSLLMTTESAIESMLTELSCEEMFEEAESFEDTPETEEPHPTSYKDNVRKRRKNNKLAKKRSSDIFYAHYNPPRVIKDKNDAKYAELFFGSNSEKQIKYLSTRKPSSKLKSKSARRAEKHFQIVLGLQELYELQENAS